MAAEQFRPWDPEWIKNPYEQYRELRAEDPVHWSEQLGHWVLTRYHDVVSVMRDPRFTATNRPPQRRWNRPTMMVTVDPPEHSRLRRPVTHHFNAPSVEALRPRMQEVVDELLDRADQEGGMDIAWDYARQLPRRIISEMLGVAFRPAERPVGPLNAMGMADTPMRSEQPPAVAAAALMPRRRTEPPPMHEEVETEQDRFFREALAAHRDEIRDDVLQTLLRAEAGGQMTDEEVLDTATILYGAGQETTGSMITNGMYALLTHPDQLRKLKDNPSLVRSAVEELLRFDAPVHAVRRKATEDLGLGGKTIRKGDKVLCMLMAANHDPEVFDRADELDIERKENYHIAFGSGVHTCLGGILARTETQVAIATLIRRFPDLRLARDDVRWRGSFVIRTLAELPVRLA